MKILKRIFVWLSSLKVAILLLFLIAISSGVGTLIPQGEASTKYIEIYKENQHQNSNPDLIFPGHGFTLPKEN